MIDAALFKLNRQNFMSQMEDGALAVFNSNDIFPISADSTMPFQQHRDILFLSGVDQEESILVLFPNAKNPNQREVLFIKETSELIAIWAHFGRPSGIRIHDDMLYVVDSESRQAEGEYGFNPGWHRGIYVGSLDGTITDFIPDPSPSGGTSFPEGIAVDDNGIIWGASVGDQNVTKYVRN